MSKPITVVGEMTIPSIGFARIDDYLGFWLYEEMRFNKAFATISSLDLAAHASETRARQESQERSVRNGYDYSVDANGVAMLDVAGTLMKHASSFDDATSTVMLRNTIRKMKVDDSVRAVITMIDSPGGTVAGAYDLADDYAALAKLKPTFAYIADLGASAAYLQAAMHSSISANRNALVGSIGTYGVVYDQSKRFKMAGIKAIVISSGGIKGAGVPGTQITAEQIESWQKEIDALNELFIEYVAKGREMKVERVRSLADGSVSVAAEAMTKGLIDQIETIDQLYARVIKQIGPASQQQSASAKQSNDSIEESIQQPARDGLQGDPVSEKNSGTAAEKQAEQKQSGETIAGELKSSAASAVEIDQACPGASDAFKYDCVKQQMTLDQVNTAFAQWQAARIRTRDEEIASQKKQSEEEAARLKKENEELKAANSKLEAEKKASGGLIETQPLEATGTKTSNTNSSVSEQQAEIEKDWQSNKDNCRERFANAEVYAGWRKAKDRGSIKEPKQRK